MFVLGFNDGKKNVRQRKHGTTAQFAPYLCLHLAMPVSQATSASLSAGLGVQSICKGIHESEYP